MAENETPKAPETSEVDAAPALSRGDISRTALAQALAELLTEQRDASREEPISAREFENALEDLRQAGWTFDESAMLRRLDDVPEGHLDRESLAALQERYPSLPREVAELSWSLLTGNEPDAEIVGSADMEAKREVVRRLVVTEELRERFYLRHCGKVPRFRTVDWEVVMKVMERGHRGATNYPYALVTLDTVDEVHGHHDHKTLTFAIGLVGLRRFIAELTEMHGHLEALDQSLNQGSDELPGVHDAHRTRS